MATADEKKLIIDGNLYEIDRALSVLLEKRVAHVAEKADMVLGTEEDELRSVYERLFAQKQKVVDTISENERYVSVLHDVIAVYDKINCVELFCDGKDADIFAKDGIDDGTVVYVKNPLADMAFNSFSKYIKEPRAMYESTFTDVCEEVYYSRTPYCILPIENSEDGRMSGFGGMIRKYELKIVMTCNVESASGRMTRFALLKRELSRLKCPPSHSEGEYLEIGLNFGEEQRLHEVLQAASFFGYTLNKIDSLPIYYSENEYYFDVVFKGSGQIKKFLFWLELEVPRYEIIGIYTHIKSQKGKNGG